MKREVRLLFKKAIDSLTLSVEIFNRPHNQGRPTTTLILLDHAFEMLLKAAILHRGGRIREKRAKQTIGFDACVRIGLSNGEVKFLSEEQALLLQAINGLRDAAQHHILEISEGLLYMQAQAAVTLFQDLMTSVFEKDLRLEMPERVLPLATRVPSDLQTLFQTDFAEIKKMLYPGSRRQAEALARLRPLVILDSALRGEKGQPSRTEIFKIKKAIGEGKAWSEIFQGIGSVQMSPESTGPRIALRLTKKEGVPVCLVPEGTESASVVAVRRVDELGYYNLGLKQLAGKVGLTPPKALAVVEELKLQESDDFFKVIKIRNQEYKQYSQKAVNKIKETLPLLDMGSVWQRYKAKRGRRTN